MMEFNYKDIMTGNKVNIALFKEFLQKPEPFTTGEELFWDDPHISKGMLEAHLNPTIDAASRRPVTIENTVKNLCETMNLKSGVLWILTINIKLFSPCI